MSEPLILTTLRAKADALEAYINSAEADIKRARADLIHVLATMALFETPELGRRVPPLFNLKRLFRQGELIGLCRAALAEGPQSSRQLAEYVIRHKEGLDASDRQMVAAVTHRVAMSLNKLRGRGIEHAGEKRGRAVVWRLRA
jgi:hypothetical protein